VPENRNFVTNSSERLQRRILKALELIAPSDRNGELNNSTDYRKIPPKSKFYEGPFSGADGKSWQLDVGAKLL
jgi:hypothetical protein